MATARLVILMAMITSYRATSEKDFLKLPMVRFVSRAMEYAVASTLDECMKICYQQNCCLFNYEKSGNSCELYAQQQEGRFETTMNWDHYRITAVTSGKTCI